MSKAVKGMVIDEIAERLGDARDLLVVDLSKMDAFGQNKWRLALRGSQVKALTVRNTLARRALQRNNVRGLDGILEGPSTLVFGGADIVALSKEITKWAKEIEHLKIKGGTVEGTAVDTAGVEALSKSPSREELIGRVAGMILAPGANLAAALGGPGSTIASQLKTIYDASGEAAQTPETA